jgi:hypothetical protein
MYPNLTFSLLLPALIVLAPEPRQREARVASESRGGKVVKKKLVEQILKT